MKVVWEGLGGCVEGQAPARASHELKNRTLQSSSRTARTGGRATVTCAVGWRCVRAASIASPDRAARVSKRFVTLTGQLLAEGMVHAWVRHTVLKCDVFKTLFPKMAFFRDECTPNSFFLSLATLVYACTA